MHDFQVCASRDIVVLTTSRVMTLDWDVKDLGHHQALVSFETKEEALTFLLPAFEETGILVKLYETPGGFRGVVLSEEASCLSKFFRVSTSLKVDPIYTKLTGQRGKFCMRVVPKPGREKDYVAKPLGVFGCGLPTSDIPFDYCTLHDALVKQHAGRSR